MKAKLTREEKKESKEKEDILNSINQRILDAIIDDNEEHFLDLISQSKYDSNPNQPFIMMNYKLPLILSDEPTYASLCAFFGAEQCFTTLSLMFPEGIESGEFNKCDKQGRSPIHFACFSDKLNILRMYDQNGFKLDTSDSRGFLPCHYSAMAGTVNVMKYLWSKGVDIISPTNYDSMTPFHLACLYGHINVVTFLNEKVSDDDKFIEKENKVSKYKETVLHLACKSGNDKIVKYLIQNFDAAKYQVNSLDFKSMSPLHYAIQNGSLECVKLLISLGKAKINLRGRKHVPLIDAAENGYTDIVLFLLKQKKVDINQKNSKGITAIDGAILNGHHSIVKILIENGSTKNFDDIKLANLFLSACQTLNLEIVRYLDSALKIPYQTNGTKFMNQAIKLENEELVDFLLDKGCMIDNIESVLNFKGKFTPFMKFLKERNFFNNQSETNNSYPLIIKSINYGNVSRVKEMIDEGFILTKEIIEKHDCILSACKIADLNLFNFLMKYEPFIRKPERYLEQVIQEACDHFRSYRNSKLKKVTDCLKIASILIEQFHLNVNKQYKTVTYCMYYGLIEFLELFVRHSIDFNNFEIDYSRLAYHEHLPVLKFLDDHGCTFQKIVKKQAYNYYNYYLFSYFSSIHYMNKLEMNMSMFSIYSNYNVLTFDFLIDHSSDDEILESRINDGNIINFCLNNQMYDQILKIYKRMNRVIKPKKNPWSPSFENSIKSSNNQELIDFVFNSK